MYCIVKRNLQCHSCKAIFEDQAIGGHWERSQTNILKRLYSENTAENTASNSSDYVKTLLGANHWCERTQTKCMKHFYDKTTKPNSISHLMLSSIKH